MPRKTRWRLILVVSALVVIVVIGAYHLLNFVAMIPMSPWHSDFVMIRDLPIYGGTGDRAQYSRNLPWDVAANNGAADYVIYEGELYLKFQETRSLFLAVQVKSFEWSGPKLRQLVKDHPELEVYTK